MSIRRFNDTEHRPETIGMTVGMREMNGYDDSDFYGIYWDAENGKAVEIMYCTTRGGSNGRCFVDAPDDVLILYYNWMEENRKRAQRYRDVKAKLKLRDMRKKTGLKPSEFAKLSKAYPSNDAVEFLADELRKLKNKSHRSSFRKSIASQVYDWAVNSANTYDKPLSYKQAAALGL